MKIGEFQTRDTEMKHHQQWGQTWDRASLILSHSLFIVLLKYIGNTGGAPIGLLLFNLHYVSGLIWPCDFGHLAFLSLLARFLCLQHQNADHAH